MFKKTESTDYFCIYKKCEHKLAQVELTRVEKTNWLITRLFVPPPSRNQGIATGLMQELTNWADERGITLIAEINPYGDLGRGDVIKFSLKHGFKQEAQENNTLFKRAPSGMG